MTQPEFDRWWSDLTLRFPSIDSWLVRVTSQNAVESEPIQRATLKTWFIVLRDVCVDDALEVNARMQAGDLEWIGDREFAKLEDVPRHVRRLARQLASDRRPGASREEYQPVLRQGGFPGAAILRRWQELMRTGTPREEARRAVLEELPVGTSNFREQRYDCHLCFDSGRVLVASNAAIEAMLLCAFDKCHHRDGVVLCKCKSHLPANPRRPLAVYEAGLDFKISDPLWGDRETLRFAEWVESQRQKRAEEMAKAAPNYEPAFAKYNQRDSWSERADVQ